MSSVTNPPPSYPVYSSYSAGTPSSSYSSPSYDSGDNYGQGLPAVFADDPLLEQLYNALTPAQQQEVDAMLPQIMASIGGSESGTSSQFSDTAASTISVAPSASTTSGAAGSSTPAPVTGSTWAPMGAGPYKVNLTNSSNSAETITLTGNNQTPTSVTLAAGQSLSLELPANYAGNISAQKQGEAAGPPTLFEFSTGNGQGSNTSWDISTIVGDNTDMHATAPGSSDVADSQSNTPGSHYIHWNDDQQRPSPVKNTTGTEMDLSIS